MNKKILTYGFFLSLFILIIVLIKIFDPDETEKVLELKWEQIDKITYSALDKSVFAPPKHLKKNKTQKKKNVSILAEKSEMDSFTLILKPIMVAKKTIPEYLSITRERFSEYLKKQKKVFKENAIWVQPSGAEDSKIFLANHKMHSAVKGLLTWELEPDETIKIEQAVKKSGQFKNRKMLLEYFGLKNPKEEIAIYTKDGKKIILKIGNKDNAKNFYYVRVFHIPDTQNPEKYKDTIFSIPTYIVKKYRTKSEKIFETKLIPVPSEFITRIEVELSKKFINELIWFPPPRKPYKIKKKPPKNVSPVEDEFKKNMDQYNEDVKKREEMLTELPDSLFYTFRKDYISKQTMTRKDPKEIKNIRWDFDGEKRTEIKDGKLQVAIRNILHLQKKHLRNHLQDKYKKLIPKSFKCIALFRFYSDDLTKVGEYCVGKPVKFGKNKYLLVKQRKEITLASSDKLRSWLKL
jgi:hypothetical protein